MVGVTERDIVHITALGVMVRERVREKVSGYGCRGRGGVGDREAAGEGAGGGVREASTEVGTGAL